MGEDEYVLIIVDENHVSTLYSSFVIFYHKEDLGLKFPKIIVKREGERESWTMQQYSKYHQNLTKLHPIQ